MLRVRLVKVLVGLMAMFFSSGCGGFEPCGGASPCPDSNHLDEPEIEDIVFSEHIQPILDSKCTGCHAADTAAAGLNLESWDSLIKGSSFGEALIPFRSDRSLLVEMAIAAASHPADQGADSLSDLELERIRRWIDDGARSDADAVPYAETRQKLYVANQTSADISIIDTIDHQVIRLISLEDLGFPSHAEPYFIAHEPDGSFWYLSLSGVDLVLKFNRDDEWVGLFQAENPGLLSVDPIHDVLFVGKADVEDGVRSSIGVIERSSINIDVGQAVVEIELPLQHPHALLVDPGRPVLYVGSLSENKLVTLDTETQAVIGMSEDALDYGFRQFAILQDGGTMFAAATDTNAVIVFDTSNPERVESFDRLFLDSETGFNTISLDEELVYFGNTSANTIGTLKVQTGQFFEQVEGGPVAEPFAVVASPRGFIYVSNRNQEGLYQPRRGTGEERIIGFVSVIDGETRNIIKTIEVEGNPGGMSHAPR